MSPESVSARYRPSGDQAYVAELAAPLVGDLGDRAVGEAHHVELAVLVGEGDALAVGRPLRVVAEGVAAVGDLPRRAGAVLGDDVELVLAVGVGEVGDLRAVRRPAGPLVVRARGVGEVAGRPVLGGHREDVAARHDDRPLAVRRQRRVLDEPGDVAAVRPRRHQVAGHLDRDLPRRAAGGVEQLELAVELVDDLPLRAGARPAHVPQRRLRHLLGGAARGVVDEQVERAGAVGGEPDAVADPHRVAVGARVVGDARRPPGGEVEDVEVLGPAAGVALPAPEVAEQRRVDHPGPVGREVAGAGDRHRQGLRQPALDRHLEQAPLADVPALAERAEQHLLAVRAPAVDQVVVPPARRQRPPGRVVGELARRAAVGGHDIDLLVAVVLPGEGDPAAVGGELGEQLDAGMGGEPAGGAAGGGGGPQVAAVGEDDAVAVDVGEAQQLGLRGGARGRQQTGRGRDEREQHRTGSRHHPSRGVGKSGWSPGGRAPAGRGGPPSSTREP